MNRRQFLGLSAFTVAAAVWCPVGAREVRWSPSAAPVRCASNPLRGSYAGMVVPGVPVGGGLALA